MASSDPLGAETKTEYDAAGRVVEVTNPLGKITTTVYDDVNRPIATVNPLGHRFTTTYDNAGQVIAETDPLSHTITSTYDAAGQRKTMVDPDSGTTASTYDDAGQLIRIANPHSETTTLVYDAAGREIRNELDNGTDNATSYDPAGRVVGRSATDSGSNVIAQYDDALDCVGNRTSMWDSDGESSNWNDDPLRQQEIDDYLPTTTGLSWMTFTLHQWDQFTLSQWDSLPLDSAAIQADSSFYHFDGTENVRKLTDDMEAVTDEYAFDAFGNELSSSGSTANSQRYKGRLLAYHPRPRSGPAAAVRVAPPPLRPVDRRLHQPRPGRGRQQPLPVRQIQPAQSGGSQWVGGSRGTSAERS